MVILKLWNGPGKRYEELCSIVSLNAMILSCCTVSESMLCKKSILSLQGRNLSGYLVVVVEHKGFYFDLFLKG